MAVASSCVAADYPGITGGDKIQSAINDPNCAVVTLAVNGPDDGVWNMSAAIELRSNLTLQSAGPGNATVRGIPPLSSVMFRAINVTNLVIDGIAIDGANIGLTGIWAQGLTTGLITNGSCTNLRFHCVHLTNRRSTDVTISAMTISNLGLIGVRTDVTDKANPHERIVVTNNTMSNVEYGLAFANCGSSLATRCQASGNTISNTSESGIDLNLSPYALVSNNMIGGRCLNGLTVDNVQNATISSNIITGCASYGIVLANGAVIADRPWVLSGNLITANTITRIAHVGMSSGGTLSDPNDVNTLNTWTNNTLSGNGDGNCVASGVTLNNWSGNSIPCTPQSR